MRCGIFVDAGYLFAQGSVALAGEKTTRSKLTLNKVKVIDALLQEKLKRCPNADLLRIYWYDGAATTGPTSQHFDLAFTENVKLRLGFLNSHGQQKGVDSLIVTDLIELARNKAIADAILLSGDEDLRVGVTIAQTYGVRVHLLGIAPSRGSQSQLLLQESDTTTEWSKNEISKFLALTGDDQALIQTESKKQSEVIATDATNVDFEIVVTETTTVVLEGLEENERNALSALTAFPRNVDGKLLSVAKMKLGRLLDEKEKRELRAALRRGLTKQ